MSQTFADFHNPTLESPVSSHVPARPGVRVLGQDFPLLTGTALIEELIQSGCQVDEQTAKRVLKPNTANGDHVLVVDQNERLRYAQDIGRWPLRFYSDIEGV